MSRRQPRSGSRGTRMPEPAFENKSRNPADGRTGGRWRPIRPSIKSRLAVGFGISMLLMIVTIGLNYSALHKLDKLHQETLARSLDMELTTDAQHIGEDMYMIIANAVINRDMAK